MSPVTPKTPVPSDASPPAPQMPERGLCVAQPTTESDSSMFDGDDPAEVGAAVAVLATEGDVEDAVQEERRAVLVLVRS